ncbi:MAG: hypothetical protein Q7J27_06095 [Syntrophales bacterium]|nr:hypothetical protein [Syntrophales bacterium]
MDDVEYFLVHQSYREQCYQIKNCTQLYWTLKKRPTEERKKHTRIVEEQGYVKACPVNLRKKDGSIINTPLISNGGKKR